MMQWQDNLAFIGKELDRKEALIERLTRQLELLLDAINAGHWGSLPTYYDAQALIHEVRGTGNP